MQRLFDHKLEILAPLVLGHVALEVVDDTQRCSSKVSLNSKVIRADVAGATWPSFVKVMRTS